MLASGLLLVALLAFLSVMVFMSVSRPKFLEKLPPGPTPLPFIGNYLQLDTEEMYKSLLKISKRYGPVFTVYLGPRRVVVLCGYDAVKAALVEQAEEFSGRGEQATFDGIFKGYGVAFSNWERAKPLRRFSIATLRDFGVGKRGIEERIQEEAGFLIETLRGTHGAFVDPTFYLSKAVSNVISSIVFGDRFDYEDKEFLLLLHKARRVMEFAASPTGQLHEMFYSVMRYLPGPQHQVFKDLQGLESFIAKKVEQNQRTLDPNSPRDFIDSFLTHMQEERTNPNTKLCMKDLVITTLNLFLGGTETASTTLRYGLMLIMRHPDVQAKVHEEINRVIGRNRQPKFEDQARMPYTEAVIHEIQRVVNICPLGVPRRVTKDTKFWDFLLPKGTEVFPMLGSLMTDPRFFSNPMEFNPQHFLDDKGQFKKSEAFVAFSLGKRYCFGEGLAKMELFLFLTTIMQNFHFKSPQAETAGIHKVPHDYTLSFLPC